MNRIKKIIITATLPLFAASLWANEQADVQKEAEQLRKEIVDDLTKNILPFWAKHAPDPEGGFYGELTFAAKPVAGANKGGILNARLVWTFSTAYRLLGDEEYKVLADRAASYFLAHFLDKEYGGVFWDLKSDGMPADMQKQSYVNAFGIYGLSEHFRATGNIESLKGAISIYEALVKHAYDPVNGGFIENFSREWVLPESLFAPKGMNNNLHVLEALTNLYRVWRDPELAQQLRRQIDVCANKILDRKTWHENLYLTMDWQNLAHIDSYGHDIEFSWLLVEAAEVLGDEAVLADTRQCAVNIAEVQMKEAIEPEGYIKGEKNHNQQSFNFAPPPQAQQQELTGEQKKRMEEMQAMMKASMEEQAKHGERLEWWPQAETVVGYVNAWQISGEKKYLDVAFNAWKWIKKYVVDYQYGEWYGNIYSDGTPVKESQKASMWRCPYHNSRMGFEIISRLTENGTIKH
ncbi:MAG: AGE family epimerase/isomerase [Dysgonamonadaceae bacterium]|jgi:mannobiose 2-epimerase|nr:AGE family epimerase/isomerase [Dysgonamonadaceae bacterium]